MKTFTLRLTDIEAEALERIAYFKGVSKNTALTMMIANEYDNVEPGSVENSKIWFVSCPEDLAGSIGRDIFENAENRSDIAEAIKYFEYGIEKHSGDTETTPIEDLERLKAEAIEELRNM